MNGPDENPKAEPGEVAPIPFDYEVSSYFLEDYYGNPGGYVMKWKTSLGSYIVAGEDSHVDLGAFC